MAKARERSSTSSYLNVRECDSENPEGPKPSPTPPSPAIAEHVLGRRG